MLQSGHIDGFTATQTIQDKAQCAAHDKPFARSPSMIEESAVVIACEEQFAIVQTQARAACGACTAHSGCSTSVLAGLFKRRNDRLRVLNPIQARPGQQVVIGIQEQALVTFSLIAYLLPLLGMLLGAILLREAAAHWHWQSVELMSILGGLSGFVMGLYGLGRFSRRHQKDQSYQIVILRQQASTPVPLR